MSVQPGHSSLVADGRLRVDFDALARPEPDDEPFALGPQRLAELGHAKSRTEAPCVGERTCPRCGETKHVLGFAGDPLGPDGLSPWCRDCRVEKAAAFRVHQFWETSFAPREDAVSTHRRSRRCFVLPEFGS